MDEFDRWLEEATDRWSELHTANIPEIPKVRTWKSSTVRDQILYTKDTWKQFKKYAKENGIVIYIERADK